MRKTPALLFLMVAVLLNTLGNLLVKRSRVGIDLSQPETRKFLSGWFLTGVAAFGLNVFAYTKSLEAFPLSVAYPILTSSCFVLVIFGSLYWFSEPFHSVQILGAILITAGILLLSFGAHDRP